MKAQGVIPRSVKLHIAFFYVYLRFHRVLLSDHLPKDLEPKALSRGQVSEF